MCYLSLQAAHGRCEVEHQLGDVLQLALQDLDGLRLLLVLLKSAEKSPSCHSVLFLHLSLFSEVRGRGEGDLLLSDAGGVLQLNDGLIESFLHLLHLFAIPAGDKRRPVQMCEPSAAVRDPGGASPLAQLLQVSAGQTHVHLQSFDPVVEPHEHALLLTGAVDRPSGGIQSVLELCVEVCGRALVGCADQVPLHCVLHLRGLCLCEGVPLPPLKVWSLRVPAQ